MSQSFTTKLSWTSPEVWSHKQTIKQTNKQQEVKEQQMLSWWIPDCIPLGSNRSWEVLFTAQMLEDPPCTTDPDMKSFLAHQRRSPGGSLCHWDYNSMAAVGGLAGWRGGASSHSSEQQVVLALSPAAGSRQRGGRWSPRVPHRPQSLQRWGGRSRITSLKELGPLFLFSKKRKVEIGELVD